MLGITGTGGSGKSSLTDELVRRLRTDQQDKLRVAVLAVDPTRRRGGGALLGDRIRMNALQSEHVFFRSLATRGARELPEHLQAIIDAAKAAGVLPAAAGRTSTDVASVIPPAWTGYLAEIAGTVRGYHEETARQVQAVRRVQRLAAVRAELAEDISAERSVARLLDQAQREAGADSAGRRACPRPRSCNGSGGPCRPTSSRRIRARTPASSPPSSPCG